MIVNDLTEKTGAHFPGNALSGTAHNPDLLFPDLFAQRIAVEPEKFRGLDLVSTSCSERSRYEGCFHVP